MLKFLALGALAVTGVTAEYNSTVTGTSSFNLDAANKGVYLSAAAYCGYDKYDSHSFGGPVAGFVLTKKLKGSYDVEGG
jgi:hypothetical protein